MACSPREVSYAACKSRTLSAFQELIDEVNADDGHGKKHVTIVMNHCTMALGSGKAPVDPLERLAVEIAGALHDADDRKLFDTPPGTYTNAKNILEMIFPACDYGQEFHDQVIRYISYVSCSSNGNAIPSDVDPINEPWWNYARLADRAEAIGGIGVIRAYQYTLHVNRPFFNDDTPLVTNDEELENALSGRFERYLQVKKSDTFIDHFYDKMFHIADFDQYTDNPYLRELARTRLDEMKSFIFSFGRNPSIQNINRWIAKFRVRYSSSL